MLPAFVLSFVLRIDMPGEPPPYARPVSATRPRYIELLEENTGYIYPAIAILVVTLIALAVISSLRTDDMDGIQKAEVKREIISEMRRELHGLTAEQLAKTLGVPTGRLIRLLEEMRQQGITECRTDTRRVTTWRLKGLVG